MDFDQRRGADPRRPAAAIAAALCVLTLCVLTLATACTSHSKTPPPASSAPVSSDDASSQLAALAQVARAATYTGTYTADSSDDPPRSSLITVFRTATRTRLDVVETGGHVLIQVDPTGTYTCKVPATGTQSCLTLAGPGQPVAQNLDPSGQALFTTTLDVLAQGADLTVATAPPRPAANGIAASECFALIAAPASNADTAAPGTYCFTAGGILTRAQFRSNVLQLTALGAAPADADFTLPVAPLPLGSPAASATPAASS